LFSEEGDSTKTIDVLINNAGLVNIYGGRTKDGFEKELGSIIYTRF